MTTLHPISPDPLRALVWAVAVTCTIVATGGLSSLEVFLAPGNTPPSENAETWPGRDLLFFRPLVVNEASAEELELLPGVGETTAWRICAFRQSGGFLLSAEELASLGGPIDPKLMGALLAYLSTWNEQAGPAGKRGTRN